VIEHASLFFRGELDQAYAPVDRILRFTSAFFSSRSTATLIENEIAGENSRQPS